MPVERVSCKTLVCCVLFFLAAPLPVSSSDTSVPIERIPLTGCLKVDSKGKGCTKPVEVRPSPTSWNEARKRVGNDTRIPHPSKEDTSTMDLATQVPRWLAMRFEPPRFHPPEPWMASVGNMLAAFQRIRGDAAAQENLLERLRKEAPDIWEQVSSFLPEWVRDDFLYSPKWNPADTGRPKKSGNDGILERPPFLMPGYKAGAGPSGAEGGGGRKIYQACAPIYASIEDVFAAENDFAAYHEQAGANYLDVYPLDGAAFFGTDPDGNRFLLYDVSFHQKPLPLWNLKFTLRQFVHQEDGRWQMENHVLSGDMNHLRLRIFYDPIRDLDGREIGFVKTEWLDVDIKGLPDGDADRKAGARGDVGNIKKAAEKRASSAGKNL